MKYNKILSILALCSLVFSSCDDQIMEWHDDPTHGEVTRDELPLELAEKISRYEALNTYTDMRLGVGVGLTQYMENESYRSLANENFDELTVGYAMKHAPMVQADGSIDFSDVDEFMTEATANGLSVFGHTLVWHSNQDASYLNGLLAATVIPGAAGSNLITNGEFDTDVSGWASWGGAKDVVEYNTSEALAGDGCMKAVTNAGATNLWDLEIQSSDIPVVEGHSYEITFFIKSEGTGHVRLAFNSMNQSYPWINGSETVTTSSTWQQVTFNESTLGTALMPASGATTMNFRFDLGADPDMVYYIDNVVMVDLDAPAAETNFLTNGDFETGAITGWGGWGGTREISADGEGYNGTGYALKLTRTEAAGDPWSMQSNYSLDETLADATEYTVTFMAKATTAATIRVQLQSSDYNSDAATFTLGTTWSQYQATITTTTATRNRFVFDTGAAVGTYYFDDVVLTDGEAASSGPTIIEKTDEEKTEIITASMEDFISQMLTHYKDNITAWDVVNEPMLESGEVRDGNVTIADDETDVFYWQKYMGKDYAVTAFNLARQYGNATDKLFINDYNLESNMTKLDGLILYVQYIDAAGATVDGIGTQMHISYTSDKDMITEMLTKLAATGKLIKISELDVRLGTKDPTEDQLAQQAEMYQYVIDQYKAIIPTDQQYGITIWGISDNEDEHEYWLPDEAPNLWDANYQRKHAYKGVADGLAGEDVSEGFTGDLVY